MNDPIYKSDIIDLISSILKYGILIGTENKIEELKFLLNLHRFINKKGKLRSYIEESKITIETLWYDALSEIIHFITFMEVNRKVTTKKPESKPKVTENDFEWI